MSRGVAALDGVGEGLVAVGFLDGRVECPAMIGIGVESRMLGSLDGRGNMDAREGKSSQQLYHMDLVRE